MRGNENQGPSRNFQDKKGLRSKRGIHKLSERLLCQSCGTPLDNPLIRGTNKADSLIKSYCIHCFKSGNFTEPNLTFEEMSWRLHRILVEQASYPAEEAISLVEEFLPKLDRWRKSLI